MGEAAGEFGVRGAQRLSLSEQVFSPGAKNPAGKEEVFVFVFPSSRSRLVCLVFLQSSRDTVRVFLGACGAPCVMELSSVGDQVFAVESITKKRVRKVESDTNTTNIF